MQKNKRVLSWVLAVLMAVALLPPAAVYAAGEAAYSILLQPSVDGRLSYGTSSSGNSAIFSTSDWGSQHLMSYSNGSVKVSSNNYSFINPFSYDGYAAAYKDGKYGIIDADGNEVIACQYGFYVDLAPDGALAIMEKSENSYAVLDIAKKTLNDINYSGPGYLEGFGGGYLRMGVYDQNYDRQYFQYVSLTGQPAFGKNFKYATVFSHGYAVAKTVGQDVYQIINTQGSAVATVGAYNTYGIVGDNGLIAVSDTNYKYGYVDLSGKVVIQLQYDGADDFHNGYAVVWKDTPSDYEVGLIDTTGNVVIPFGQYETLSNASNTGLVWATDKNNKTYILKVSAATAFSDVPANAYYAEPVAWAVENGIVNGTTPTTFSPNQTCTQVMILTLLWRAAKEPASSATLPFTVNANLTYAEGALRWAYEKGMIGADFDQTADCTRATAVKFMWLEAKSPAASKNSSFTDVPAGADYAKAVDWAVETSLVNGTSPTTFSPDQTCTRAEIVTLLHRNLVANG